MKKYLLNLIFMIGISSVSFAQSNFNYQAVLRDDNGEPITNSNITIQFDFLEDNILGIVMYSESHDATTNDFGEFNVIMGTGALISGGFNLLDFSNHLYYLTTTINGENMGTTEIQSVPVAHTALNAHWDRNIADELHYDEGEVIIGSATSPSAEQLTIIQNDPVVLDEIVDIRSNVDLQSGADILNLYTTTGSNDEAQFMECRKGNSIKFSVDVSGKVHSDETGNAHLLPIAYGKIASNGAIQLGTNNYSISQSSTGIYQLTLDDASINPQTEILVNATGEFTNYVSYETNATTTYFYVRNSSGTVTNGGFSFTIFKP